MPPSSRCPACPASRGAGALRPRGPRFVALRGVPSTSLVSSHIQTPVLGGVRLARVSRDVAVNHGGRPAMHLPSLSAPGHWSGLLWPASPALTAVRAARRDVSGTQSRIRTTAADRQFPLPPEPEEACLAWWEVQLPAALGLLHACPRKRPVPAAGLCHPPPRPP